MKIYLLKQDFSIPKHRRARLTELLQGADGGTPYPDLDAAFAAAGLRSPDDPFIPSLYPEGYIAGLYPIEEAEDQVEEGVFHAFLERIAPVVTQSSKVQVLRPGMDEASVYTFRKNVLNRGPLKGAMWSYLSTAARPHASLYCRRLRAADSRDSLDHKHLARWQLFLQQHQEGIQSLERSLQLDTFFSHWERAETREWLIEAHLDLYLEDKPLLPLEEVQGLCMENLEVLAASRANTSDQSRLDGREATCRYALACVHARRGQREEGLAQLQRALALDPEKKEEAAQEPHFARYQGDPAFQGLVSV